MDSPGSKYDVFLSFRGETRNGITDHLYCALKDDQFNVFLDKDELTGGDPITESLKQAIKDSRLAAIMFSKGYAESRWCLEELVEIMECCKKGQLVFPIFFDIAPSDVRHQAGSFATAFQGHEQNFNEEKVGKWRDALKAAADLSGEDFLVTDGRQGMFIRKVVRQIAGKLKKPRLKIARNPVGIDSRAQEISNYLDVGGSSDVRIIGIWGMGGLGKTTVAKAIFNEHHYKFDGACFLSKVREEKLVDLQNILLSEILKSGNIKVSTADEGTWEINTRLRNIRVLVIIDDIDCVVQMESLAIQRDSFGPGSRIVITTRDEHLLRTLEADEICSPPAMNKDESLELLSQCAFGKSYPDEEHLEVSGEAVDYCGGLPLALEAVGSYLRTKPTSLWTNALSKWKRVEPYYEIRQNLEKSYVGLTGDKVKDIFLDISCFFIGLNKDRVMAILDGCNCNPAIGIAELHQRCLVTVDLEGNLMMHHLIRDMGRDIVRAKSPKKLGSRCRLWDHEDVKQVLTKQCGTEEIVGIALDFPETDKPSFSTEAFIKMPNLRLLKIKGVKFTGHCKDICEEIRWLSLSNIPSQDMPEDFNQPNVVDIDLCRSNIQLWKNSNVPLEKLMFLNLGYCDYLEQSPDFSRIPNIEKLILEACKRLSKIHDSLGELKNLKYFSVAHCKNLQEIPHLPTNLEILKADECTALETMPDFSKMSRMIELHLNHSPKLTEIRGLCQSLFSMTKIRMEGCTNLTPAFKKKIVQRWSASRNDLFLPGNDLLSGFTCVEPKDEIVSALFLPGNDLPSGFECVDPMDGMVMPQCFGYDAKALTLCIVFSSDNYQSGNSLCIRVENRTKETETSSSPMHATVINRQKSYIWLGHLSNNKLNVNGGDKINVRAHFVGHGSSDDIHLRVQKMGVYLEQENLVNQFSSLITRSSDSDMEVNLMQNHVMTFI